MGVWLGTSCLFSRTGNLGCFCAQDPALLALSHKIPMIPGRRGTGMFLFSGVSVPSYLNSGLPMPPSPGSLLTCFQAILLAWCSSVHDAGHTGREEGRHRRTGSREVHIFTHDRTYVHTCLNTCALCSHTTFSYAHTFIHGHTLTHPSMHLCNAHLFTHRAGPNNAHMAIGAAKLTPILTRPGCGGGQIQDTQLWSTVLWAPALRHAPPSSGSVNSSGSVLIDCHTHIYG